jgi:hypothetical protein
MELKMHSKKIETLNTFCMRINTNQHYLCMTTLNSDNLLYNTQEFIHLPKKIMYKIPVGAK